MRYFFLGMLPGILINFFVLSPSGAASLSPVFTSGINTIETIEQAPVSDAGSGVEFPVKTSDNFFMLNGHGKLLHKTDLQGMLTGFSGNGQYFVKFEKTGKEIELFNLKGERFWKQKSREYPYLSHNGALVLLMNGDHSAIRILDYNGNEIGAKKVIGRLCTIIAFSSRGDVGGIGFLDGSYYIIRGNGEIIASGITDNGTMIKGLAISDDGSYAGIHYGSSEKDRLIVLSLGEKEQKTSRVYDLPAAHVVKTAMYMSTQGLLVFLDIESLLILGSNGKLRERLAVPAKRNGQSDIHGGDGFFTLCYTMRSGESLFAVFQKDGTVLYKRVFPGESFLSSYIQGGFILLRGSDNLYCYNLRF